MTYLSEPPAAPAAGQTTRDAAIEQQADQLLAALNAITPAQHPDARPKASIGTTAPVPQPDSRIAPRWAVGLAVASIGVGAGSTGLGCAAWLFFKGLSMVSVPGLERFAWIIIVSFGGLATAATAIGGLISKAKRAAKPEPEVHHHYTGPVHQDQRNVQNKNNGVWVKNTNE